MISVKAKYIVDTEGNRTNGVLSTKDYDRLLEYIEDLEDITAYDRAQNQSGKPASWKKIRR